MLLSIVYVAILFAIASWGDGAASQQRMRFLRPVVYSLALGVYCTSWTFYGAVGTAANTGWGFLPIYLGPICVVLLFWGFIRRIVAVSKRQNLTSIADFISARYGRGRTLAVLVTLIAVIGSLPYIALQLKAVADGFHTVTDGFAGIGVFTDTALLFAGLLAVFAIAFGTRQIDASEHHAGMILAIAFESLVKLLAFVAVGVFALVSLRQAPPAASAATDGLFALDTLPDTFVTQCLLASAAVFCLPRQFHVAVVEAHDEADVRPARWLFPLYLAVFSVFVVPITYAGLQLLPSGAYTGDTFVLALPMQAGQSWLTVLAYIGGFSAATGMVIVATVTLSTMVSNEIVMPSLFRIKQLGLDSRADYSAPLLLIRRVTIIAIVFVAYLYYRLVDQSAALASIGLLSFAAAAQFAPPIVLGMLWPQANRRGAIAGLSTGFALWLYTLFIPALEQFGVSGLSFVQDGPFGAAWLRPEALLVDLGLHPLSHGVAWSLLANIAVLIGVSLFTGQSLAEKIQARAFVARPAAPARASLFERGQEIVNADLRALAERFVGARHATRSIEDYAHEHGIDLTPSATADRRLIQFTERLLAGAVGASSARVILTAALRRTGMQIGDVVMLLDETSQAIRFNRKLLEAALENMSQGVSVLDGSQRLIGWNSRYQDMMAYPPEMLYAGKPVAELLQHNAERGHFQGKDVDKEIAKRLAFLRAGTPYRYESAFPDGRVIEIRGQPMPDGGYVTTFSDITESKQIEITLRDNEKRLRTYTENVPAMIAYVDREGIYRFANNAYAEYAGLDRDAIVGRRIDDVLDERDLMARSPYLDRAFDGERQSFELELRPEEGAPRYTLGTYIPDVDENGNVTGVYATFQDITTRRRAELALVEAKEHLEQRVAERTDELAEALGELQAANAAAQEANASKTRFFAAAAHDLLQPINASKLFSALLTEHAQELPDEQRRLVERIEGGLVAVEELLNALLDISRLDAGGHTPVRKAFPVAELFAALEAQFRDTCAERGLTLRFVPTATWVDSDPVLLRRILQNFISNARRYTERGGIVVGCRRRGERVALAVYDTGVGIAEPDQRKVFEEFARLPISGSQQRGLGLGLAIVERIARLLEHPVAMRSREGRGSCFEVVVPRAQAAGAPRAAEPPGAAAGTTQLDAQPVLCVDNEPDILDGMQALLARWGAKPLVARDLAEAEAAVRALEAESDAVPRLLIVDYHLDDGATGVALVRRLREVIGRDVPAMVVTADRTSAVKAEVAEAGCSILHKPVKPAALRALITSMLGKSRAA